MKEKLFTVLNTKTKKIVAGGITILVLIGCGGIVYSMTKDTTPQLKAKKDSIVVEYGQQVNLEANDYVDTKKIDKEEQESFMKQVNVSSDIKNEGAKEYPGIGKYTITLKHEKQSAKVKVEVKDTVAPVFNETNEITFEEGTEYDYAANITATDLQEVEVAFDTSGVNKDVAGEYSIKATAKDKSGNQSEKDIKVVVTAKPVVEEPETSNTPASNTTTNNSANSASNNASKPATSASGQTSTQTPDAPAPAPAPEKPAAPVTPAPVPQPQPEPAKPKFVLPADYENRKFFMTREEAHAYVKQHNLTNWHLLCTHDDETETYYYMLTID